MQGVLVFNCINADREKKLQVVETFKDLHLAVLRDFEVAALKAASAEATNMTKIYFYCLFAHFLEQLGPVIFGCY